MDDLDFKAGRHGLPGYFALADLPQAQPISENSIGTGWWEMDQLWKLYAGQFTIVTGIAGHGKSTFVLNVLCNIAKTYETNSFLYVPENEQHLLLKLKAIYGDDEGFKRFSAEQCFIRSSYPTSFKEPAHTLDWVLDQAVVAHERDGVDILMIDPWNELERAKQRDQLLTDYIGECLQKLKQYCRRHGVAVILVAHPTKAGIADGKTPGLGDIEGSLAWFNKCDNGLIVVRPPVGNTSKIISAKVREIGAGKRGECWFMVDEKTGQFSPQPGGVSL